MSVARVNVPAFLDTNTGYWLLDSLPCVTLLTFLPAVRLFIRSRRYFDACVGSLSVLLALLFHACHMHPGGLRAATFLGLDGPTWRTLDILVCQFVLVRTVRDAVGSRSSLLVTAIPNFALPAVLSTYAFTFSSLPMRIVAKVTLLMTVSTLVAKLLIDGTQHFPAYTSEGLLKLIPSFVAAFICFWLPHNMPGMYFFWHSLWHLFLGTGYYFLYVQLALGKGHTNTNDDDTEKLQ